MKIKITYSPQQSPWLNKNIFKLLGVTLFASNFSVYSSLATSNIEIPNRYQTLEGEYITIDDSTEGELHEIEIFGNTIQDENNLEDIQSVGDLYVDSKGNPILDSEGRQQYKIEIISENKYSYGKKYVNWDSSVLFDGEEIEFTSSSAKKNYMNFKENTQYTFKFRCKLMSEGYTAIKFYYTDGTFSIVDNGANLDYFEDIKSYKSLKGKTLESFSIYGNANKSRVRDFSIIEGNEEDYLRNEKELILPTQLQKVGDVADRLYWDNEKGRYVIEKNIKKVVLNGSENWTFNTTITNGNEYLCFCLDISDVYSCIGATNIINNKFANRKVHEHTIAEEGIGFVSSGQLFFRIHQSRLYDSSVSSFKEYLSNNNVEIFYWLNDAELIETDITSKIKVPTYENKTHIYVETENGANPTLKVKVDRINDLELERKYSSANVDIYIKSQNMLSMTLSTNTITFEDYSGVDELEESNAIKIDIDSSLPYQLNAYLIDEIKNANESNKIDIDRLQIKDNDDTNYKEFADINNKLVLKNDCTAGNDKEHYIDLKLKGGDAYPADIYKTVIKFEAEQK